MINGQMPATKLYCKDSKDKIREWGIYGYDFNIITHHGVVGGQLIAKNEQILEGKASRTRHEQMVLQISSDIKSKKDKGYVEDIEVAKNEQRTNAAGLLRPMLAHTIDKMSNKDTISGAYWSRKLNGHRCLITKQDGELITYSRNGKTIDLPHLYEGLELHEGETLDGELYIHGVPLRTLSSLIKKPKEGSTDLKLHCYDYISKAPFNERYKILKTRFDHLPNITICEQVELPKHIESRHMSWPEFRLIPIQPKELMRQLTAKAVADGYEGGIIRLANAPYLDGKKTNKMLKLKSFLDDEFMVRDIKPSREGWAVLTLIANNGKEFGCSAPGNRAAQYEVMENAAQYIGRFVQVKYFELTTDGIPFHPVPTPEGWVDRGELG